MSLGLLHIYTGEGKGKTTTAAGLAARAAGHGIPVVFLQFLKGGPSGEIESFARLPGITVLRGKAGQKFVSAMSPEERRETRALQDANLRRAAALARAGRCGLLVLDEVMAALRYGLVDEGLLRELLADPPAGVELVLTGRDAPGWLLEQADYVTEMRKIRHPYDRGITAREGIEY